MSQFWSDVTRNAAPYVPGEQPQGGNIIKLNTNENPYPPSPKVIQAIKDCANEHLRLYPSPDADDVRRAAAKVYNLNENQVFVGNGSDEVLAFSFLAFFNPGRKIFFPDITYSFYPVYARLYGLDYEEIPLADDFSLPVKAFFNSPGGVIFPNPNAPTGLLLPLDAVEEIVMNNENNVVIVDEAYIDFGGESAVSLIGRHDNLLVIQTLSKSRSLAGLRVGFAFGSPQLMEGLNRIKNSFNSYTIDRLAMAGAKAALEDAGYFKETTEKIIATREQTARRLRELGFTVLDSKTNFVFATHKNVPAKHIFEKLREKGIYVRYFNQPRIDQYVRITIGTPEEMEILLTEIKKIVSGSL